VVIKRAYRTELRPTAEQARALARHSAAARVVYNWALWMQNEAQKDGGKMLPFLKPVVGLKAAYNEHKRTAPEWQWLYEVNSYVGQSALDDLNRAFTNFFRKLKEAKGPLRRRRDGKLEGYPRFRRREDGGRFRLYGSIHVFLDAVQLPTVGRVRLKEKGYLPPAGVGVRILNATVSERAGRWFVSLQVEEEVPDPEPRTEPVIGVDVGIKSLAVCSDGTVFENPKALKAAQRKLQRLQRAVSRRVKGSANRRKAAGALANAHYRVTCVRRNAAHQASHTICEKAGTVVIEDLNVAGMVKNHSLAGAVSDAGMAELHRQICYKQEWSGGQVAQADRWFPSSKRCSRCGAINEPLTLSDRVFRCEACGFVCDRDRNATLNLEWYGKHKRAELLVPSG